ncbi:hypothetical protein TREES_T100000902 [Tupaia chinensis]|uniref:Uncharacterized protein n=1 Tax=Tupaia chinensis TaxID=246437 RepID=L9JEL2_TUPCH|nr:hypothetical protein TREES_T100000902 [Tupaia chinensis]
MMGQQLVTWLSLLVVISGLKVTLEQVVPEGPCGGAARSCCWFGFAGHPRPEAAGAWVPEEMPREGGQPGITTEWDEALGQGTLSGGWCTTPGPWALRSPDMPPREGQAEEPGGVYGSPTQLGTAQWHPVSMTVDPKTFLRSKSEAGQTLYEVGRGWSPPPCIDAIRSLKWASPAGAVTRTFAKPQLIDGLSSRFTGT